MDPLLVTVLVGALGTVLVGTVYFLWLRTEKKPQPQQTQQQPQPQQ